MVQNGTGYEMRKVSHEQRIVNQVVFPHFAPGSINQESDLRECEERNAEGKNDVQGPEMRDVECVEVGYEEIGVFVVTEQRQIACHGDSEECLASRESTRRMSARDRHPCQVVA